MELQAKIKKITTKEKDGIVTISTTFETEVVVGSLTADKVSELSAMQGYPINLTVEH